MNKITEKFDDTKILVAGDLMIDEYLWGRVDRISPEAPVPVVSVEKTDYMLGGAGNVMSNLAALGGHVHAAGLTGHDTDADMLIKKIEEMNIDSSGIIRDPQRPTTKKTRIIAVNQHVLRIDREIKKNISEKDSQSIKSYLEEVIPNVDMIIVSDYDKGFVTHELMRHLIQTAKKSSTPVMVDPKGLDFSKYSGASIITPNQKEAAAATRIEITDESRLFKAGKKLLEDLGLEKVIITCGKDGMALFEHGRKPLKIPSRPRQVFDVSGAGDTAIATLAIAMASGVEFARASTMANAAAGIVVGKMGAASISREELTLAMETANGPNKYPDAYPDECPNT